MQFKEESIQLVATDENNQFYVTPQAKQLLATLNKPIAIVSIAGMYRTGKSYLVNRLLKTKQVGFKTGSTTQSVTKGLNLWGRPIPAEDEDGNEMYYIVIDSEGIGSCQQQVKYDLKVLMLVFLISSTVVYNSMGAIDELALDQLRVVVNLKQNLMAQPPAEKTKLVWVLRDFALQLVDKNGFEMTPNQYLEQCLEETYGNGIEIRKKNEIRKAIKEGLGKKCCFTLVRPTINEEDLVDLTKCKLRTEFINQIEAIREEVFSGSREDLKRIGGSTLNGKILINLLQQCVSVLNSNGLPEMGSIWESVRQMSYEETFEEICGEMKKEMNKIVLPISKQEMKYKLNQIQNKFYTHLERQFNDIKSFKHYQKQFLRRIQKMNRDIKKTNGQLVKDKVMKEIREFVKNNISFQNVQPTNLSGLKILVDRMELKVKGESEGYEYVLNVLFDLIHISEQKALAMQRQLSEFRKIAEIGQLQRKNNDLNIISLKQDYHEALKTINNLKLTQEETQKTAALAKHQREVSEINFKNYQQETQIKESNYIRQIEQLSFKARQRNEEMNQTIKRLRQENSDLESELESFKHQRLREGINQRKEVIFEEKMKETWDKFEEERMFLRNQIHKLRKETDVYFSKYQQQKRYRQKEAEQYSRDKESFAAKERQFVQQFKELKALQAETKKTFSATFDTMKDKDRIFRSIENVTASNSKLASCKKNLQGDEKQIRRYYETHLQKAKLDHEDEVKYLNQQICRINKQYEQLKYKSNEQQMELKACIEERQLLQKQLIMTSQKFADAVSEIETAKQRERSLYEESIVRLMSNLDKREQHYPFSSQRRF